MRVNLYPRGASASFPPVRLPLRRIRVLPAKPALPTPRVTQFALGKLRSIRLLFSEARLDVTSNLRRRLLYLLCKVDTPSRYARLLTEFGDDIHLHPQLVRQLLIPLKSRRKIVECEIPRCMHLPLHIGQPRGLNQQLAKLGTLLFSCGVLVGLSTCRLHRPPNAIRVPNRYVVPNKPAPLERWVRKRKIQTVDMNVRVEPIEGTPMIPMGAYYGNVAPPLWGSPLHSYRFPNSKIPEQSGLRMVLAHASEGDVAIKIRS